MTKPTCPALTRGLIAACRCCRWTGGGPGVKCLEKLAEWQERKDREVRRKVGLDNGAEV